MTAFDAARACDIGRLRVGDLQQQGLRHGERGALDERERGIDRGATEAEDKGIEASCASSCCAERVGHRPVLGRAKAWGRSRDGPNAVCHLQIVAIASFPQPRSPLDPNPLRKDELPLTPCYRLDMQDLPVLTFN